jgi:hypothetical protein
MTNEDEAVLALVDRFLDVSEDQPLQLVLGATVNFIVALIGAMPPERQRTTVDIVCDAIRQRLGLLQSSDEIRH